MMGCRATAVGWITRLKPRHYKLDSMSLSTSTARIMASWSGSSTGATHRTFTNLVLSSPRLEPPPLRNSPHFVWRMFSSTDDKETDDERTTKTVEDYFNDNRFFKDEEDRKYFVNRFARLDDDDEEKLILSKTTHEFYLQGWNEGRYNELILEIFFSKHIYGCKPEDVLLDFYQWKRIHGIDNAHVYNQPRLVDVDFQIKNTKLSHQYDLDCFSKKVDDLFECHENDTERKKYVAPYFCFVQSSGMGKTKILWEYQNKPDDPRTDPKDKVTSFVIIPTDPTSKEKPIFHVLDLDEVGPVLTRSLSKMTQDEILAHAQIVFREISIALDTSLEAYLNLHLQQRPGTTVRRVALLFDESQKLLKEEYGYKAFRFRCIRLWLMEKPNKQSFRAKNNLTVVAVFSGTSSKLTNFLFENDSDLANPKEAPSRNLLLHRKEYYDKGEKLHSPFWQTTTTGSCLSLLNDPWKFSEYERAIYYGRPLFALMMENDILHDKTQAILYRMLHLNTDWAHRNRIGWINLLSSRVQLGQVSLEMASDLVAYSYANLCASNEESRTVHLGYFPDPVPARLAMCMMDEDFAIEVEEEKGKFCTFQGKDKQWWSNTLKFIFANEMVRPDKGDAGEIFVALYMLYCGDLLRKHKHLQEVEKEPTPAIQPYSQFSVSLDSWLQLMLSGGKFPNHAGPDPSSEDCEASVGFIQVCRNPLRSYNRSWKSLKNEKFLKYIYESGIGFFHCNNGHTFDMVVPIRIKSDDGFSYVPMLISIKSFTEYQAKPVTDFWEAATQKLNSAGISRALCLCIVFGMNDPTKPAVENEYELQKTEKIMKKLKEKIVMKEIRVPKDDVFGISAAFADLLPSAQVNADIFASHAFLKAHGSDTSEELKAKNSIYTHATKPFHTNYDALRKALTNVKVNPQDAEASSSD